LIHYYDVQLLQVPGLGDVEQNEVTQLGAAKESILIMKAYEQR